MKSTLSTLASSALLALAIPANGAEQLRKVTFPTSW